MPRPIEMNAHDPRRYLGDMLAWVHQALASERELLISLFGQDNQSQTSGSHADSPSDVPSSSALLDKVLEGVCRPLKVSIHALIFTFSLPCLFLRHQHASARNILPCKIMLVIAKTSFWRQHDTSAGSTCQACAKQLDAHIHMHTTARQSASTGLYCLKGAKSTLLCVQALHAAWCESHGE